MGSCAMKAAAWRLATSSCEGDSMPKAEAAAACCRPIAGLYIVCWPDATGLLAEVLADMGGDRDMERSTTICSSRLMPAKAAARPARGEGREEEQVSKGFL